jgi:hypothetical protein
MTLVLAQFVQRWARACLRRMMRLWRFDLGVGAQVLIRLATE